MEVGFAGAGGVGCYFGALMANANVDITLIGRGDHLRALAAEGLRISINENSYLIRPRTADTNDRNSLEQISSLQWLFISCKAHQSEELCQSLRPHLSAQTNVVSLQNGVDGPPALSRLLDREVIGGLSIGFVSHVVAPGRVEAKGQGNIVMGRYPNGAAQDISQFCHELQNAGVDVRESADIRKELWRKIIINNGVNPLSALLETGSGFLFGNERTSALIDQMMAEAVIAAEGDGVTLTEDDVPELRSVIHNLGDVEPSMLVDIRNERLPELDAISGAILKYAKRAGKETPVTEVIHNLLSAKIELLHREITT